LILTEKGCKDLRQGSYWSYKKSRIPKRNRGC